MSTDNQSDRTEQMKKTLFDLQAKRKKIEDEILMHKVVLENNKVGMKDSLTDREDFPRNDIDVFAVRHARASINKLEYDAREVLNQMQTNLEELHSLTKPPQSAGFSEKTESLHLKNLSPIMITGQIILRDLHLTSPDQISDRVYRYNEMAKLRRDLEDLEEIREIVFITSNRNKANELTTNLDLENLNLKCKDVDLVEIQGSDEFAIIQDKSERAFNCLKSQLSNGQRMVTLVDDTSLEFSALNGMPGPYVKWFLKAVGPIGLFKMLAGFEDKRARAVCTYALMPSERWIVFFRGFAEGRVVEPRGNTGWGWDPIFEEQISQMTFGEMQAEAKAKCSHRAAAINLLREFLKTQRARDVDV